MNAYLFDFIPYIEIFNIMPTSSKFAVAVHLMVDLSLCKEGEVKSSRSMALKINTNPVVIRRIYSALQTAGLVGTKSGKLGGAYLRKRPSSISLWHIYQATGDLDIFCHNPNQPYSKCDISCSIEYALEPVFQSAYRALKTELNRQKLSDVVARCQLISRKKS